jgi:hypothetical protein
VNWGENHECLPGETPVFFSFGGRVEVLDFCCSQCVPIKFSMHSQHVPLVPYAFPNMLPMVPDFTPISFARSFTSFATYISSPKEEITTYLIWVCSKFYFIFIFWWANQRCPFSKGKNLNFLGSLQLINMSHNTLPYKRKIHARLHLW